MANVLIIDDDRDMSDMLFEVVGKLGHTATTAFTLEEGLGLATKSTYTVILLDVRLPDGDGVEWIPAFRVLPSPPEVIIITGFGSREGAELALNSGAWDYISKTTSISEIRLTVSRAIQYKEQQIQQAEIPPNPEIKGLVWKSDRMALCITHLTQALRSDASVLINGETGTGKELFAQAIHDNGSRAARNFVTVDCASLPPTLAESLLFGHEKGAFTGAEKSLEGLIKQADGGTLFLDEIGELPPDIQKSFLRVLQERRFRPLGGKREVESDFRLVAATNRHLEDMVASGRFRNDLLHRIQSIVIQLPPLRKRREDIIELILYYTKKLCDRYSLGPRSFSPEFLETMVAYDWPGNVRELINCMEWSIAAARQDTALYPKHLPTSVRMGSVCKEPTAAAKDDAAPLTTLKEARATAVNAFESQYLHSLLTNTEGNIEDACRISGLSRPQLYLQMRKHNLKRSHFIKN